MLDLLSHNMWVHAHSFKSDDGAFAQSDDGAFAQSDDGAYAQSDDGVY